MSPSCSVLLCCELLLSEAKVSQRRHLFFSVINQNTDRNDIREKSSWLTVSEGSTYHGRDSTVDFVVTGMCGRDPHGTEVQEAEEEGAGINLKVAPLVNHFLPIKPQLLKALLLSKKA